MKGKCIYFDGSCDLEIIDIMYWISNRFNNIHIIYRFKLRIIFSFYYQTSILCLNIKIGEISSTQFLLIRGHMSELVWLLGLLLLVLHGNYLHHLGEFSLQALVSLVLLLKLLEFDPRILSGNFLL